MTLSVRTVKTANHVDRSRVKEKNNCQNVQVQSENIFINEPDSNIYTFYE